MSSCNTISVIMGDIVDQEVDAIVNAANNSLLGGGGVDGAIHMQGGNAGEDLLLADAYRSCLELAMEHEIRSIAFPGISIGAYGFPVDRASVIAVSSIREFLQGTELLTDIRLVCFNENAYDNYSSAVDRIFND